MVSTILIQREANLSQPLLAHQDHTGVHFFQCTRFIAFLIYDLDNLPSRASRTKAAFGYGLNIFS